MIAPVMPHQAEDIWQHTPEIQKGGLESILLADWPLSSAKWHNEELEKEFTQILKLREIVSKAIEPLRATKRVGSSLEVAVYIQGGDRKILNYYEDELANIFITSQAFVVDEAPSNAAYKYEEDGYTIYIAKAIGEKCERCWKYRELGTDGSHPTLCAECAEALNEK